MRMRLLVYCGTKAALDRFDNAGWPIMVPRLSAVERDAAFRAFRDDPDGRLAVIGRFMITGWRAPEDTFVLFDPSWQYGPGSPEWAQAAMRRPAP